MTAPARAVAEECTVGSDTDRLTFPEVLARLAAVDIEGYHADLRRSIKSYYLANGQSIEVPTKATNVPVAETFDATRLAEAVRQSQAGSHTYEAFCEKAMAAGCAGYIVSLPGRRVAYYGRTAETHVEHFR